jgi:N-acetylglucosaminyldiphosphoundecaprenol N-acetyl-beta-D-mannosaminyltransferase
MSYQEDRISQSFFFAGVKIDNFSLQEVIVHIERMLKGQKSHYIVTPNAAHIVLLQKDEEFKRAYKNASLVLPDGMSLIWASRLIKPCLKERITGTDLVFSLCNISTPKKHSIFLLGAENEIVEKAKNALLSKFLDLQIVGIYNGYFKNSQKVIEKINALQPDILFIGIGFAKQEKWISRNINKLNIKVAVTIGGVFDVIAGKFKPAPRWMQNCGLEWLWRLIKEPRRLWRRYLIINTIFLWLLCKELLKKRIKRNQ